MWWSRLLPFSAHSCVLGIVTLFLVTTITSSRAGDIPDVLDDSDFKKPLTGRSYSSISDATKLEDTGSVENDSESAEEDLGSAEEEEPASSNNTANNSKPGGSTGEAVNPFHTIVVPSVNESSAGRSLSGVEPLPPRGRKRPVAPKPEDFNVGYEPATYNAPVFGEGVVEGNEEEEVHHAKTLSETDETTSPCPGGLQRCVLKTNVSCLGKRTRLFVRFSTRFSGVVSSLDSSRVVYKGDGLHNAMVLSLLERDLNLRLQWDAANPSTDDTTLVIACPESQESSSGPSKVSHPFGTASHNPPPAVKPEFQAPHRPLPHHQRRRPQHLPPHHQPEPAPPRQPGHLPHHQPEPVPSHQPSHLPLHQPDHLPPHQPGHLPPHQPGHLPPHQPEPVPSHQPGHLPPHQPSHLPPHQPGHLPHHQPEPVPSHQPGHLPHHQPSHLPPHQPGHLPPHQPGHLPHQPEPVPHHPEPLPHHQPEQSHQLGPVPPHHQEPVLPRSQFGSAIPRQSFPPVPHPLRAPRPFRLTHQQRSSPVPGVPFPDDFDPSGSHNRLKRDTDLSDNHWNRLTRDISSGLHDLWLSEGEKRSSRRDAELFPSGGVPSVVGHCESDSVAFVVHPRGVVKGEEGEDDEPLIMIGDEGTKCFKSSFVSPNTKLTIRMHNLKENCGDSRQFPVRVACSANPDVIIDQSILVCDGEQARAVQKTLLDQPHGDEVVESEPKVIGVKKHVPNSSAPVSQSTLDRAAEVQSTSEATSRSVTGKETTKAVGPPPTESERDDEGNNALRSLPSQPLVVLITVLFCWSRIQS